MTVAQFVPSSENWPRSVSAFVSVNPPLVIVKDAQWKYPKEPKDTAGVLLVVLSMVNRFPTSDEVVSARAAHVSTSAQRMTSKVFMRNVSKSQFVVGSLSQA